MSADLQALTDELIRRRDEHLQLVEMLGGERDRGYVNGYGSALALLRIYTGGEYGQDRGAQGLGGAA
ncbi:MAG: hypothetical protein JWQ81_6048 [Amycolatopsis sp.]|uniref:hypothetical protein n=1 Tax=Amycolatopsis sp. TaxID=37632 RepID=UPI00263A1BA9|nr:hypothetical protein [Amycolatopsis sp.]MCU1685309.1 hypothetical protein [Amycolatopsis sp.]